MRDFAIVTCPVCFDPSDKEYSVWVPIVSWNCSPDYWNGGVDCSPELDSTAATCSNGCDLTGYEWDEWDIEDFQYDVEELGDQEVEDGTTP